VKRRIPRAPHGLGNPVPPRTHGSAQLPGQVLEEERERLIRRLDVEIIVADFV
jgi:hypothetical protein